MDKDSKNVAANRKTSQVESAKAVEENTGLKAPTGSQLQAAQADGVKEAVKENAKETYKQVVDTLPGEPVDYRFSGNDETTHLEPHLDLGVEEFTKLVSDEAFSEVAVAGILKLERAGKNRTDYVQVMCKRLKVKSPYEVTNSGPAYTNDVSTVTTIVV